MPDQLYPLDLKLWEAACAERATRSEIDRWIYHLVDTLCEAGFDARIYREGFGRTLAVEDLCKSIDGISGRTELEGLFDFLADLGIRTEIYPISCLNVLRLGEPAELILTPAEIATERHLKTGKDLASFHGSAKPLPMNDRPSVAGG